MMESLVIYLLQYFSLKPEKQVLQVADDCDCVEVCLHQA